jgi:hypothetical protein
MGTGDLQYQRVPQINGTGNSAARTDRDAKYLVESIRSWSMNQLSVAASQEASKLGWRLVP